MANERITENLVRDDLRKLDYYSTKHPILVEEQKSEIESIKRLLRNASKTGKGGIGSPEFLITNSKHPDILIIFECKAEVKKHESAGLNEPAGYAVDGALHYAAALKKEFNVIAIAVSGQSAKSLKISTYLHPKGAPSPKLLTNEHKAPINQILAWDDYLKHATYDPSIQKLRHEELMDFSRQLHDFMRDHAKLTESEKPLLVSGTLIALQNSAFAKSFDAYSPEDLQKEWMKVIRGEIDKATLPKAKKLNMTQPYSSISVHPELGKTTPQYPKGILYKLIKDLNDKVWSFISIYHDFDVVGQFYGEFLKYTGGDKKALGIVLTPRHITDLFARLANLKKDSKVLDICTGTGGFLVSAMHHMMQKAVTSAEKEHIKKNCLIGVENQPHMYALAASNMILRGDGKANLHQGSCFDTAIAADIKEYGCTVGMLNPPYSQGDAGLHELSFLNQMLNYLAPGAIAIAIIPMSCVISPHPLREELMRSHTLEAVMSMPDELFYPVGTVTCITVWKAHEPHVEVKLDKDDDGVEYEILAPKLKTWFGYWKDDGFVKTKHKGRIDQNEVWPEIRDSWIESYKNKEVIAGKSIMQYVTPEDEWCAEAYMETDYSSLTQSDYEAVIKNYLAFRLLNNA